MLIFNYVPIHHPLRHPVTRLFSWGLVFFVTIALLLDYRSSVAVNSHEEINSEVVHLGQEFKLRVGNQVGFEGENLKIKFLSVASDSRCPEDVTCVWGGNAEVLLEICGSGDVETVKLNTNRSSQSAKEGKCLGYGVDLIDLSPYPRRNKRIEPTDYVVTLVVSKD